MSSAATQTAKRRTQTTLTHFTSATKRVKPDRVTDDTEPIDAMEMDAPQRLSQPISNVPGRKAGAAPQKRTLVVKPFKG